MPLSETATIRVNAEHAQARALFQAIGDGFDRLEKKGAGVNRQQKSIGDSIARVTVGYMSFGAAIGGATRLIQAHNVELARSAQLAREAEEAAVRFAIQANAFDLSDKEVFQQIAGIGAQKKVSVGAAHSAATQLVSSGFTRESVLQDGALGAFLEALQATNQSGQQVDPADLAKAMAKWLDARGEPLSAEGITRAAVPIANLFGSTDVQMSDLTSLSGEAAGMLTAGMTTEDMLGAFQRMLKISRSPEQASTALGRIVTKLSTASQRKDAVATLERLGLNTADVNVAGQRFPDILDSLGGAIDAVPEAERLSVLTSLVGEERAPALAGLIANRGDVRARSRSLGDAGNFRRSIARFQGSTGALETQLDTMRSIVGFDEGQMQRHNQAAIDYYTDVEMRRPDFQYRGRYATHRGPAGWPARVGERWVQQAAAALFPESFYHGTIQRGLGPQALRQKMEVEFVAPTGQRVPGTMQQKPLQGGF